ncbi:RHTO0S21e01640g1_1 [Rhodotorula toruloides]|uniref:RHTO0S21e01640g1_1 n=1 Tax=Rhodotorula toruloides TaxID=5286 RepID=A0A061BHR1_RHOTO|nr:RHTO0S21e01640g1_1 [Rhodotorula toruloides]
MVEGDCLVCGTSTTKRCKPCLEQSGIDLFFCSPDCQTLVWPGHRSFCGKNAFPVRFPLLSKNEALDIIPNVEVPLLRFNLGNGEEKHSLLTFFQTFLHPQVTRQELASRIWAITETDDGRANEVVVMAKANQALLYKARFSASPCANDKPLKELVITLVTQLCCDLNEVGLFPVFPERTPSARPSSSTTLSPSRPLLRSSTRPPTSPWLSVKHWLRSTPRLGRPAKPRSIHLRARPSARTRTTS